MEMVGIKSGSWIPFVIRPVFLKCAPRDPLALHMLNLLEDTPDSMIHNVDTGIGRMGIQKKNLQLMGHPIQILKWQARAL